MRIGMLSHQRPEGIGECHIMHVLNLPCNFDKETCHSARFADVTLQLAVKYNDLFEFSRAHLKGFCHRPCAVLFHILEVHCQGGLGPNRIDDLQCQCMLIRTPDRF